MKIPLFLESEQSDMIYTLDLATMRDVTGLSLRLVSKAGNPISDSLLPWWPFTSPYLITEMEGDFIVFPNKYFHTYCSHIHRGCGRFERKRKKERNMKKNKFKRKYSFSKYH